MVEVFDVLVVLGAASLVATVFHSVKIPPIVAFIAAGIAVGPSGFGLIKSLPQVDLIIEGAALLLMFTIGLEFSLKQLSEMRRSLLLMGLGQVLLTICLFSLIFHFGFGMTDERAIFMSFLVTLSSTAVIMKILGDQREGETPHGKAAMAVALMQDLAAIPMIIVVPYLSKSSTVTENFLDSIFPIVILVVLGLFSFYVLSKYVLPFVLHRVSKTRNREVFFFTILFICVASAALMHALGLSISLGAFIAGMLISASPYGRQATADFLPLREAFLSLFFVTAGMLVDLHFLVDNFAQIFGVGLLILSLKALVIFGLVWFLGNGGSVARASTWLIFQMGEFSFILAEQGMNLGLMDERDRNFFVPIAIMSLISTPLLFKHMPKYLNNERVEKLIPPKIRAVFYHARMKFLEHLGQPLNFASMPVKKAPENHVLIIGFGLGGKSVARVLKNLNIPYLIIETNAETVNQLKDDEPILFGDASSTEILHNAGIEGARLVIAVTSSVSTLAPVMESIRRLNKNVPVLARTNYLLDLKSFKPSPYTEFIVGELETSLELIHRTLQKCDISKNKIEQFVSEMRVAMGTRVENT